MNTKTKIELPSLLAFERKLETSDGLMYAGKWDDRSNNDSDLWQAIKITKRQNRSTISAHGTKDDDKAKPNPVSSDSDDANLPMDKGTLKLSFTIRVIGNLGQPFSCNEPDFEKAIINKINQFKRDTQVKTLADRYAYNIANGRFLWRNRVCAEKVEIHVNNGLIFNSYDFTLNNFDKNNDNSDLKKLSSLIQQGLNGENDFTLIKVAAYVKLGDGQHVFPSQEMNMKEKGKVLFKLDDCAAMHNVKIGNAIRTIDDWYKEAGSPIAIEPFGSVTQRGQAYRKSKDDLYTLMINWVKDEEISDNAKNYVVANIIRGGVFSKKS